MQIKLMGGITSIRIIKLCGKIVGIPLNLIFRSMFEEGVFPYDWKKKGMQSQSTKETENVIKNYRLSVFFSLFLVKF